MPDTPVPPAPRSRRSGTLIWLAVLLALNVLFVSEMLVLVPRTKRTFDEYGLQLMWPTKVAIQCADLYNRWIIVLIPLQLLLTLGGVVLARHQFRTPKLGNVFGAVCLFLLVGLMVACAGGLMSASFKLAEGMAK